MLLRAIRITMPAVEAVEIPWLMGRMDGHAGKPRLLEIDHTRSRDLID